MTAPRPTMKSIQKRLYTALPRAVSSSSTSSSSPLPRVRSNSASRTLYTAPGPPLSHSFFDSPPPPPPSSRPGNPHILSTTKIPVDGHPEPSDGHSSQHPHPQTQLPSSLALTSPQTAPGNSASSPLSTVSYQSSPFFPYTSFAPIPFYSASLRSHPESPPKIKRHRPRYHLDVGAYGIPKRCRASVVTGRDSRSNGTREQSDLAVQVGEDAYFVRDNAMGVADGVGGWAKASKHPDISLPRQSSIESSPSALFARRLMHYCSNEVAVASSCPPAPPSPLLSSRPQRSHSPFTMQPWSPFVSVDARDLEEDLEDSLEELEEGLDVLMILERAYERTMHAHVVPAPAPSSQLSSAPIEIPRPSSPKEDRDLSCSVPTPPHIHSPLPSAELSTSAPTPSHFSSSLPLPSASQDIPLLAGSSTALLAVLDHSHSPRSSDTRLQEPRIEPGGDSEGGAVIKIAHLGDCMGMLVRGEDIVWRSEEMWWSFNTPLQLGPTSRTRPSSAHVFTLPVVADDILILASDGLSDNLWDEDVLEEVVRFRQSFIGNGDTRRGDAGAGLLGRRTLAGMLSEALCSRARHVAERNGVEGAEDIEDEVPFARRAREAGRTFRGGKNDDISVIVAVISPANA